MGCTPFHNIKLIEYIPILQSALKNELPFKAKLKPIPPTSQDIESQRPYRCHIEFNEEQFSITPGQAAVFYTGEVLLGGGIIQNF